MWPSMLCCDMCFAVLLLQVGFKLDPTMFSNAEKQQLPMERCMRILPHQQVGVSSTLCQHPYLPAACCQQGADAPQIFTCTGSQCPMAY